MPLSSAERKVMAHVNTGARLDAMVIFLLFLQKTALSHLLLSVFHTGNDVWVSRFSQVDL